MLFYSAVAYALHLDVAMWDLAVIVPVSFVVQMLPVSVGGFGVREAFFSYYFHRIGQPIEDAVLLSLVAQALLMLFSLSGLATYHLAPAPSDRLRRKPHDLVEPRRLVHVERPQVRLELLEPRQHVVAVLGVVAVHVEDRVADAVPARGS